MPGQELLFQLLSRLGLELPPNEGQNPIARALRTDPYTPDDEPYLRQFMGIPKDGGLTPTGLRPASLTVNDTLPWFRPAAYPFPEGPLPVNAQEVTALQPSGILPIENAKAWPGLGHFKASVGKGASGDPFLSVYDKWDMESPVISPLMQALLGRMGTGFHVYERYPLQRGARGYELRKDIELPDPRRKP